jgi:hypothetical protein
MNLCYNFLCYKFFIFLFSKKKLLSQFLKLFFKAEIENVFINNKIYFIYFNVQKKIFYIKII